MTKQPYGVSRFRKAFVHFSSLVIAVGGDTLVSWISGGKFTQAGFTLFLMFLAWPLRRSAPLSIW